MSANEVLEQVKALPPQERRKFFNRIHELEAEIETHTPGVPAKGSSIDHTGKKSAKTPHSMSVGIRHHPYDPYNSKVQARRMKLIDGLNVRHNRKIADAEAALEKVIDEMYPETRHSG